VDITRLGFNGFGNNMVDQPDDRCGAGIIHQIGGAIDFIYYITGPLHIADQFLGCRTAFIIQAGNSGTDIIPCRQHKRILFYTQNPYKIINRL